VRNLILTAAALLNALFVFAVAMLFNKVMAGLWIVGVVAVLFRVVLDHLFPEKAAAGDARMAARFESTPGIDPTPGAPSEILRRRRY
jgi:hypothetical protein